MPGPHGTNPTPRCPAVTGLIARVSCTPASQTPHTYAVTQPSTLDESDSNNNKNFPLFHAPLHAQMTIFWDKTYPLVELRHLAFRHPQRRSYWIPILMEAETWRFLPRCRAVSKSENNHYWQSFDLRFKTSSEV